MYKNGTWKIFMFMGEVKTKTECCLYTFWGCWLLVFVVKVASVVG